MNFISWSNRENELTIKTKLVLVGFNTEADEKGNFVQGQWNFDDMLFPMI